MKSSDLIKLIEANGWVLVRVKGSHHQFRKDGVPYVSKHQIADAKRKSGLIF